MTHPIPKPSNHTKEAGMSTQEKLAALAQEMRERSHGWMHGTSLPGVTHELVAAWSERIYQLLPFLSEHGGGGEADQRELIRRLYIELLWCDRQLVSRGRKQGGSVRDALADALAFLKGTPPTPSTPVVDDAMVEMLRATAKQIGDALKEHRHNDPFVLVDPVNLLGWSGALSKVAAALSGVSAPVGVESPELKWALDQGGVLADWCNVAGDALHSLLAAYERRVRSDCKDEAAIAAEPWRCAEFVQAEQALAIKPAPYVAAAAPRVEHPGSENGVSLLNNEGCGTMAYVATPADSEDGLPELPDLSGVLVRNPRYDADQMRAYGEQCRRLAASGQGVRCHHPDCEGECLSCLIERRVLQEFGTQGLDWLMQRVAAPAQEKGNG